MTKTKLAGLLLLAAVAGGLWYHLSVFVPGTDAKMNPVNPHPPHPVFIAAQKLHPTLRIADLHTDTLLWRRNPAKRHDYGHVDIPRLREGGVDLQVFSAVTKSPRGLNFGENAEDAPDDIKLLAMAQLWPPRTWNSIYERAAYQAQRLQKLERDPKNGIKIVRRAGDLDTPDGVIATLLLTEGSHPLEGKLENIARLYNEGYRAMGLQHFFDNELGGSMHGAAKGGLTEFGREAVLEMVRQGIMIDVAHSSEAVVRDVLNLTDAPIFISHGGVLSHCAASKNRNLPDDLTKAIADRGGIIGIGYFEPAICDISPAGIADAIIDAVDVLGIDAVALGSDFDGTVTTSLDTSELAAITHALLERDVPEADIRKIMGENAYRYFAQNLPQ
ncbi:dipeptidase [Fretibacter rubidus]|uniref:dipeptidase n=1 Tax=Fretibacter rubidus TaxID=570162 RepID=UPI00352AE6F6